MYIALALHTHSDFVPGAGLEPARANAHWILSPTCLPIPPPGRPFGSQPNKRKGASAFSWSERRDSNSRPRPWQGRALPAELLSHNMISNIPLFPFELGMQK